MLILGLASSGCTTVQSNGMPASTLGLALASAGGPTIAIESIDGPPPGVFRQLVTHLGEAAEARKVALVSREGAPRFRVRAYLSAHVERGNTSVAWVLDMYGPDSQRAIRISGEEPGGAVRDAWSAADEAMLRRIARTGMDRIAAFLVSPEAPAVPSPTPEPAEPGIGIAAAPEAGPVLAFATVP
jgi:hypothetical protein